VSSAFNVTVTKPQQLEIRITDQKGLLVGLAIARGPGWVVHIGQYGGTATFTIVTYLSEAKMTEVLQALVKGYQ
jgi:hypothetical protein